MLSNLNRFYIDEVFINKKSWYKVGTRFYNLWYNFDN